MVIIQIWGGLGNQMFEYAFYRSFLEKGIKTKLDSTRVNADAQHNGYELERIFNIKGNYCSTTERAYIKPISKLLHILFNHPYNEQKWGYGFYNIKAANIQFGFLKGYWQTEKYFKSIEEKIRAAFIFPDFTDEKNINVLNKIKNTNSVSLHIRRGDYLLNNRNWSISLNYYFKAINLIKEKVLNPYFYIFSDDINWARENIKEQNVAFIDWNNNENSFKDMQLMSNCKHNIIANSSFSWWGAWLNNNPNKIVIAPNNWPNMEGCRDILPKTWISIP